MPYDGTVNLLRADAVCDVNYNVVVTQETWTITGGQVGAVTFTKLSVACDCCKPCICCCVAPDAGGANNCCANVIDTFAPAGGDLCNTGGGPASCPGNPNFCVACNAAPHTRSKGNCLNSTSTESGCIQSKVQGSVTCGCNGANCSTTGGLCNWIKQIDNCTIQPSGGC